MHEHRVKNFASVATFSAAEKPFVEGQLRTMTWQTLEPITQHDIDTNTKAGKLWRDRCTGYWERQQRKFGVVMSDLTIMVDDTGQQILITTAAAVLKVLPGSRI